MEGKVAGQYTILSERAESKPWFAPNAEYDTMEEYEREPSIIMTPKNNAFNFHTPKSNIELDFNIQDYYASNTYLRTVDADEQPMILEEKYIKNEKTQSQVQSFTMISDVKNIHICSDH